MEETFFAKVIHAVVFIAICTTIVFVGWREPLRYRFMSAQEIGAEHPAAVVPEKEPAEQWRPAGTALNRGPYRLKKGDVFYTKGFDPRGMGTASETDKRPNVRK